jgi:catechol 2,3-dioxygenase-like lactoylglutathione lyase family enzyme
MILNHIDLQVSDTDAAVRFFETFFGLQCAFRRRVGEKGQIAFLKDDGGFEFGVSNLHDSPPPVYPPDFHIGFVLDSVDKVRAIYEQVKKAGVRMKFDLQEAGPNLAFQCLGPDGIPVEVRAPLRKK